MVCIDVVVCIERAADCAARKSKACAVPHVNRTQPALIRADNAALNGGRRIGRSKINCARVRLNVVNFGVVGHACARERNAAFLHIRSVDDGDKRNILLARITRNGERVLTAQRERCPVFYTEQRGVDRTVCFKAAFYIQRKVSVGYDRNIFIDHDRFFKRSRPQNLNGIARFRCGDSVCQRRIVGGCFICIICNAVGCVLHRRGNLQHTCILRNFKRICIAIEQELIAVHGCTLGEYNNIAVRPAFRGIFIAEIYERGKRTAS